MGEALLICREMKHLDISHNKIKWEVLQIFGEVIKDNHTLWGLHLLGNEGKVDSLGFVRTDEDNSYMN